MWVGSKARANLVTSKTIREDYGAKNIRVFYYVTKFALTFDPAQVETRIKNIQNGQIEGFHLVPTKPFLPLKNTEKSHFLCYLEQFRYCCRYAYLAWMSLNLL